MNALNNDYGQLFDEQTVRNKLREYVDEGIIIAEKQGKTMYYSLSRDMADEFVREYRGLDDALKFFSETQHFGIVGNSILRTLGLANDTFFIKHNYIIHTLEDILIPELLTAIAEKRCITFTSFSNRARREESTPGRESAVVPMRILVSVQTGRRYLAAYLPEFRQFNSFRLDNMKTVKTGCICEDYDALKAQFEHDMRRCFGVSFGMRHESGEVTPMRITLFADEKNEPFILERIRREKRCCTLEQTGEHLYTLTADVLDPNEVMHWAKTFIGRIVSIDGGADTVRARFYDDIRRMNTMYGGDEDESVQ